MMAVELATGKVRWKTPNPDGWGMTHSSVAPMDFRGSRQYIYCTTKGVLAVDARDGSVLWTHPWTIGYAVVPMPIVVAPGRVFLSGGYRAESVMLRLVAGAAGAISVQEAFRCPPETFGSDQQTPILYQNHLYGVVPKGHGQLACMDLDGNVQWTSGFEKQFHLGPYLLADGMLLVLGSYGDTEGVLHLVEARPEGGYHELARAKLLKGHDCWGPMALVNGKLLLRDSNEMLCVKVGRREP
jgi:outer membrane protein assembly factor BamB